MDTLSQYVRLRNDIDTLVRKITCDHEHQITCKARCSICCQNLSLLPVEFFAIKKELEEQNTGITFDSTATCGFLKDNLCQIYAARPIICRTHGLPIAFFDDEEECFQVSFCYKNFTTSENIMFDQHNTCNIDDINALLNKINQNFLSQNPQLASLQRIEMQKLLEAESEIEEPAISIPCNN